MNQLSMNIFLTYKPTNMKALTKSRESDLIILPYAKPRRIFVTSECISILMLCGKYLFCEHYSN